MDFLGDILALGGHILCAKQAFVSLAPHTKRSLNRSEKYWKLRTYKLEQLASVVATDV
jgi:hypothetical protein